VGYNIVADDTGLSFFV